MIEILKSLTSPAAPADPNSTSTKGFLHLLSGMIVALDLPELFEINERVKAAINKLGNEDEKISKKTIKTALEATLAIIPAMQK
uniref:Uncharacterized protein n=1 Tax=Caenorhabditis japonica TaxID=281687 RepID=A0A8R1IEX6_CAEJA